MNSMEITLQKVYKKANVMDMLMKVNKVKKFKALFGFTSYYMYLEGCREIPIWRNNKYRCSLGVWQGGICGWVCRPPKITCSLVIWSFLPCSRGEMAWFQGAAFFFLPSFISIHATDIAATPFPSYAFCCFLLLCLRSTLIYLLCLLDPYLR